MKPENSRIKSDILLRVRMLYLLFVLAGGVILVRLVWVQFFSREVRYNANRLEQRIFTTDTLRAHRGSILDRNGEPLATSIFRYSVEFDFGSEGIDSIQTFNEQSDSLAKLLSAYFGDRTPAQYREMFRREHARHYRTTYRKDTLVPRSEGTLARWFDRLLDREFVVKKLYDTVRSHTPVEILPRKIDYTEWEVLRKYPLLNWNMGMVYQLREEDERVYPQGDLARRTIGLTGDRGNYGIEAIYREELAGQDGTTTRQRIARGFRGRVVDGENIDPVDGMDVVTTLDTELQDVVDRALRERLTSQNALWGTTVVMEVRTGEILAMANLGRTSDGRYMERENYAIGRKTEPGSTFKLASMLALIDEAGMDPATTYDTGDGKRVEINGIPVQDSHGGYHDMDFRTAVEQSSNVYFAKAIWEQYANNKKRYSDYLRHLHLDRAVGLEPFGERPPTFHEWSEVPDPNSMLIRRSFGYRILLAPIQVLTLYNAVANNGRMIAPVLVKELRRDGKLVKRFSTHTLVDRICSDGSLALVRECLEGVSTRGTAANFFRDTTHYRVAAKTGTAQYADHRIAYGDGYYVGTMVAYFPADAPRYSVITTIHTKRQSGKAYYGGPLAGPVVKQMVHYLYNRDIGTTNPTLDPHAEHYPTQIKSGDINQIRRVANELSPAGDYAKREGWGRTTVDSEAAIHVTPLDLKPGTMPDVRGMGLKDALFLLESQGLAVQSTGRGRIVRQSIAPGTSVARGATVQLTLQ